MVTYAIAVLILGALGYAQVRNQRRLRGLMAQLPIDARRRMTTVFPAVMGLIIVAVFVAIYLLRPRV